METFLGVKRQFFFLYSFTSFEMIGAKPKSGKCSVILTQNDISFAFFPSGYVKVCVCFSFGVFVGSFTLCDCYRVGIFLLFLVLFPFPLLCHEFSILHCIHNAGMVHGRVKIHWIYKIKGRMGVRDDFHL